MNRHGVEFIVVGGVGPARTAGVGVWALDSDRVGSYDLYSG